MIAFTFPFILVQIIGPIVSLVLCAAYFREMILLIILIHIIIQFLPNKCYVYKWKSYEDIKSLYIKETYEEYSNVKAKQDSNAIFYRAVFTAWISPCTVWSNNLAQKSYFLLISSTASILTHITCLVCILFFNSNDELSTFLVPVFHCQNITQLNLENVIVSNSSYINLCNGNDTCLPIQRACSESENPTDQFLNVVLPIGLSLLFISFLSSVCLQLLGNYYTMYKWSKAFFCCGPIVHLSMLQDLIGNLEKSEFYKLNELLEWLLKNDRSIFQKRDPVHGDTLMRTLLEAELFEELNTFIKLVTML